MFTCSHCLVDGRCLEHMEPSHKDKDKRLQMHETSYLRKRTKPVSVAQNGCRDGAVFHKHVRYSKIELLRATYMND